MLSAINNYSKRLIKAKRLFFIPISQRTLTIFSFSSTPESVKKKPKPTDSVNEGSSSHTISYLINSCGLSPEIAKSTAEIVNIETPEKPDSVLELLKSQGFEKTHISCLVRKHPKVLLSNPEKILLPKLRFFNSIGLSKSNIGEILSYNPRLLSASLQNQLIPSYKFLQHVFHCDKTIISLMQFRTSSIFYSKTNMVPNVTYLIQLQVPPTNIKLLLSHSPIAVLREPEEFRIAADKGRAMGFHTSKCAFVLAISVLVQRNNKMWNRCFEAYKKWGWSEDDILMAFKKHPLCMTLSQKKIDKAMDFFVNKMGFEPKAIAETPIALSYGLEKRIIPRYSVIQILVSKGLVKKVSLWAVLPPVEKKFLERFVTTYKDEVPQLMSVYLGSLAS